MVRYVSLHLPKSGGSSIRISLEAQFGDRALLDYGRGPLGPRALDGPLAIPVGTELVHGHFRPGRYVDQQAAYWFTFLREPVDLLFSFYFFWQRQEPHHQPLHDRFLTEKPTIEAFAMWSPIRYLSSRTFFGDFDMRRFDYIGFHDTRVYDIVLLNHVASLQIDPFLHFNATEDREGARSDMMADTALVGRLRDTLKEDVGFYEAVRSARA